MSEDAAPLPKPMVEVGGQPILWHVMKTYAAYGIHDFVICCGLNGAMIKRYLATYFLHTCDLRFDLTQADTANLGRRKYVHDIQIRLTSGMVYTIEKGTIQLEADVTKRTA